jgi:hypothetical protein
MRFPMLPSAGFAFALFATASVASACGYHGPPDSISTFPGLGFYRPDIALLLPILSGTIERPIYSLAGYRISTLGYSIQANLLAALATNVLGIAGYGMFYYSPLALGVPVVVAALALIIKLAWFSRVPRVDHERRRTGWFVMATILSTITIATIPFWMSVFGTDRQSYAMWVSDFRPYVILMVFIATVATHVKLMGLKRDVAVEDPRRGFDVMSPTPPVATLSVM